MFLKDFQMKKMNVTKIKITDTRKYFSIFIL